MLCKTFEFAAAHRLYRAEWSLEKNLQVFGKCASPNGHGHNYRLEVRVSGDCDPTTGMVLDAALLESLVEEHVLRDIDHKNIDRDVEWLAGQISTVENIIEAIWKRLEQPLRDHNANMELQELVLWETGRIYALRRR